MEKSITSNNKISYTILCMIFSILFIFTALNLENPIVVKCANARTDAGVLERRQA